MRNEIGKTLAPSPKHAANSHWPWHPCYGNVMRITLLLSSVAFLIACGPPPEDDPIYGGGGIKAINTGGVAAPGGEVATGGSPAPTGGVSVTPTGGTTNTGGGTTNTGGGPAHTGGGTAKTGGSVSTTGGTFNPFDGGSVAPSGGVSTPTGGTVARTGGTILSSGTGGATPVGGTPAAGTYNFGAGDEPCANPKDVSLKTPDLGTGAACYRTADDIQGWGASNFEGKTLKVNRVAITIPTTAGATMPTLPPKLGSFYYFDVSEGGVAWASLYWYGTARAIPTCGSFPAWVAGATNVAACAAH